LIDARAARHDPDGYRAAVARKGAGEAFDAWLAADERWRELVPRVDDLRSRQKLQGKPTPEQVEELKAVKEELRRTEEQLAAAEADREAALTNVPNPPHESVPDGDAEEDAVEIRRWGEPPQLAAPKDHVELGRFEMERAARVSGTGRAGDLPTRDRAAHRAGVHARAPARAGPRAGDVRHRLLPDREVEHLRDPRRRPLSNRDVRGRPGRHAHGRDR
jgi:seryl-tRNA synthetase